MPEEPHSEQGVGLPDLPPRQPRDLSRRDFVGELLHQLKYDALAGREYLLDPRVSFVVKRQIEQYEDWVYASLKTSRLAVLLPGGLELLSDIYAAMPWYLRLVEQPLKPRSHWGILKLLYGYLPWFIDPSVRLAPPVWMSVTVYSALLAVPFATLLVLGFEGDMRSALLTAAIIPVALTILFQFPRTGVARRSSIETAVNKQALYWYLAQAYEEVRKSEPREVEGSGLPPA